MIIRDNTYILDTGVQSFYVLTSLSCFFDMKTITEMVENDESHDKIKERLLMGEDWKPEIEKFIPKWLESMNFIFQSGSSDYVNIL